MNGDEGLVNSATPAPGPFTGATVREQTSCSAGCFVLPTCPGHPWTPAAQAAIHLPDRTTEALQNLPVPSNCVAARLAASMLGDHDSPSKCCTINATLEAIQRGLNPNEKLLAFLDDVYFASKTTESWQIANSAQEELWTHCRIRRQGLSEGVRKGFKPKGGWFKPPLNSL